VAAGKKAFIMNAFGDATFALAIFLLIQRTGSVEFDAVFSSDVVEHGKHRGRPDRARAPRRRRRQVRTGAAPHLAPDAMEGPTPVSALIHAATMVTAGVYLIARTNVLFELAPAIQDLAGILGGVTILLAGLVALVQTDIKRVIAYSTMSQIGYMFVAVGLGAYGSGLFHLMTHAFFKALLFMAAGIVIHALSDEQDIRRMAGPRARMPFTYRVFVVGALSLAAIPPFSGFFSKDSILGAAANAGTLGWILWTAGAIGAFLTALYTFRLLFIVFWGEMTPFAREHLHLRRFEGGLAMAWPVAILAVLSFFGGWLQVPWGWDLVNEWIDPVAESAAEATGATLVFSVLASPRPRSRGHLARLALVRAAERRARAGRAGAFRGRPGPSSTSSTSTRPTTSFSTSPPRARRSSSRSTSSSRSSSLRSVNSVRAFAAASRRLSALQTGYVREYAFALAAGLAVLAFVFILVT
jgi:NADH-quinone oxidoreductase subunit L